MKKTLCILLAVLVLTACIPAQSVFAEQVPEAQIIRYADRSCMVITIREPLDCSKLGSGAVRANKSGSVTADYYESTGILAWTVTLTAAFTYNGTTSSCTSANVSVNIFVNSWYTASRYVSWSGNTAAANVTMAKTVSGTTISVPVTLTLSCDANGNLY